MGRHLYPRVPDLARPAVQHLTDGELHYAIVHGMRSANERPTNFSNCL
jgi:hypothetical protein